MSQKTNISILVLVLSIPFALSSQTRKAIPAGRYEALSGIKTARTHKSNEAQLSGKESMNLFLTEVVKNIPQGKNDNMFFSSETSFDNNFKSVLASKGALESKNFDSNINILLSDNLNRDKEFIKKLKAKGSLVVLKEKQSLKDVMSACGNCDVLVFQADSNSNYFLLKLK
jgi:small nuclear ribonucleoprotein (snRNP)-like protein